MRYAPNDQNDDNDSDQQTAVSSTLAVSMSTTTSHQRRRRQSLRSYLKGVSLYNNSFTTLDNDNDTPTNTAAGGADDGDEGITASSEDANNEATTIRQQQQQRRGGRRASMTSRRLEVMGLLQHLKINHYDSTITNSANNAVNATAASGGGGEGCEIDNSDRSATTNITMHNIGGGTDVSDRSAHSLLNSNHLQQHNQLQHQHHSQLQQQQRCLLHPTVRLRNDKCSLCCALTKTLEIREKKRRFSSNSSGGGGDNVQEDKSSAVATINNDGIVDDGGGGLKKDGLEKRDGGEGGGSDEKQQQHDDDDDVVVVEDDDSVVSEERVADDSIRLVVNATTTTSSTTESKTATVTEEQEQHCRQQERQNESVSMITTAITTVSAMDSKSTSKENDNDEDDDISGPPLEESPPNPPETSTRSSTAVGLTALQRTIALAKGALLDSSARSRQQQLKKEEEDDDDIPSQLSRNLFSGVEVKSVPLNDVVAAVDPSDETIERRESDNRRRRRGRSKSRRHSSDGSSCEGSGSESQQQHAQPPIREVAAAATMASTTITSSDTSVKSTSDSSTLTSSTWGTNSLGTHNSLGIIHNNSLSAKSAAVAAAAIDGDDDNPIDRSKRRQSKRMKKKKAVREAIITSANHLAETVDETHVPTTSLSNSEENDAKPSVSVDNTSSLSAMESKTMNNEPILVEDVYSDSDEENDHVSNVPSNGAAKRSSFPITPNSSVKSEIIDDGGEGIDNVERNSSVLSTAMTPIRKHSTEKEQNPDNQSPSPNSVIIGEELKPLASSPSLEETTNELQREDVLPLSGDSAERHLEGDRDSSVLEGTSPAAIIDIKEDEKDSNNMEQTQFSEVEKRLSRKDQRLSRATGTRRDGNTRRSRSRSRSQTRKSQQQQIPFFSALVDNARSRSRSRSRQRSRSESITRKGIESSSSGANNEVMLQEKEKNRSRSRQRSRGRSIAKNVDGTTSRSNTTSRTRHRSRSQSVNRGGPNVGNNDNSRHRQHSRSRSIARKRDEQRVDKGNTDESKSTNTLQHEEDVDSKLESDISSMKLKHLRDELDKYDVDYSSFREKSEFQEALRNARGELLPPTDAKDFPEVAEAESAKTEEPTMNLHREPITHPRYQLGESAREGDMMILTTKSRSRSGRGRGRRRRGEEDSKDSSGDENDEDDQFKQSKIIESMKELRHLDAAFIRRSNGSWTYALVVDGDSDGIRFVLNKKGATKTLTKDMWNKNVRRIKVLTQRKGDVINVKDKPPRKWEHMSKIRSRGRIVSPSPTRHYRYRKSKELNLPPTIMEGKVFWIRGRETGLITGLMPESQVMPLPEWKHLYEDIITSAV